MNYQLNTLFHKSSKAYAAHTAIQDAIGNKITYKDLYKAVFSISELLTKCDIHSDNRIGVLMNKNIDYIACVFSVLNIKSAYVPLDPHSPITRVIDIIEDCDLKAVFVETNLLKQFSIAFKSKFDYKIIKINKTLSLIYFKQKTALSLLPLAYIIYTSGSTGTPKGVMHTHQSAWTFINWSIKKFKSTKNDTFISHAPFHFDLSIFDLFVSIAVGAKLVLVDYKISTNPLLLSHFIDKNKVSLFYTTPSTLMYLLNFGKLNKYTFLYLKTILFAGEVFPIESLKNLKIALPHVTFFNLYGPTETNVCTFYKIPKIISDKQNGPFPIGKPCSFARALISAEQELFISGKSLMAGYWNDIIKTKKTYYIDKHNTIWYKTGDIVTESNTILTYISRKDRMIKKNGFRIELEEIENCISKNHCIQQVAVTNSSLNSQTYSKVTAHIVLKKDTIIKELELFQYCNSLLPKYMIPDQFKFHKALPLTSTNKIDYKKLTIQND